MDEFEHVSSLTPEVSRERPRRSYWHAERWSHAVFNAFANVRVGGLRGAYRALVGKVSGRYPAAPVRGSSPADTDHVSLRFGTTDVDVYEQVAFRVEYDVVPAKPPTLIIDCGAHIGLVSRFFAQRFPEATVIAIEPDAQNFSLLVRNTSAFPNVVAYWAAVTATSGPVMISNPDAESWRFQVTASPRGHSAIPGWTVESILAESGHERIDILKMDIEGTERDVLSHAEPGWIDLVDLLLIETHDQLKPGSSRVLYSSVDDFPFEWRAGEVAGFARTKPRAVAAGVVVSEWRHGGSTS